MWKYKNKIIRVGKSWVDDEGIKHPWNWMRWNPIRKQEVGMVYVGETNGTK